VIFSIILIFLLWILMSLISLNHLFGGLDILTISTKSLGILAWISIGLTSIFLSRAYWKQVLIVFCLFFFIGYLKGPYLEPPADPLYHAQQANLFCGKESGQIERKNKGLLHYSMASVFICGSQDAQDPEKILKRFDLAHGCFIGIALVVLFIIAKSACLSDRWAFMSILIAFLFLGTNRFSFFSHYSLAPSCSSLLIYWLWIAAFFFRRTRNYIYIGLVMSVICLPVLIVNHLQEAFFIVFITSVWLMINFHEKIWYWLKNKKQQQNIFYVTSIFLIFFILPQFAFFQKLLSLGFERNLWQRDRETIVFFHGFHLFGKIWSYRIIDTLAIMGFLPLLLSLSLFLMNSDRRTDIRRRVVILGILPFIGYLIPLYNYAWLSNSGINVYYRLCYCSIFWLAIAFFLSELEKRISLTRSLVKYRRRELHYFLLCLAVIMLLGGIRSGPVFGKLDFIFLESRPWWMEWKPIIKTAMMQKGKTIISDPQTSTVLTGIFNIKTEKTTSRKDRDFNFQPNSKIQIKTNILRDKNYKYIVNFRGFTPSWVPDETGHWNRKVADTLLYYRFRRQTGKKLIELLRLNPLKNCEVYY
jgi:hypothetical protein